MRKLAILFGLVFCVVPLVTACETEKDRAAQTALAFKRAKVDGDKKEAWEMVSQNDRDAKNKEEFTSNSALAEAFREGLSDKVSFERKSVEIDDDRATVTLKATIPDLTEMTGDGEGDPDDVPMTTEEQVVELIREEANGASEESSAQTVWRVDTMWAEEARRDRLEREAESLVSKARRAYWNDELKSAKQQLNDAFDKMPDSRSFPSGVNRASAQELKNQVESELESLTKGHWRLDRSKSKMTDEPTVIIWTPSTNAKAEYGDPERAKFLVRCKERNLNAFLAVPEIVDSTAGNWRTDSIPMRVRLDDTDPETIRVFPGEGSKSVFFDDPRAFLDGLDDADRFRAEVPTHGEAGNVWSFRVEGISEAKQPVLKACGD